MYMSTTRYNACIKAYRDAVYKALRIIENERYRLHEMQQQTEHIQIQDVLKKNDKIYDILRDVMVEDRMYSYGPKDELQLTDKEYAEAIEKTKQVIKNYKDKQND